MGSEFSQSFNAGERQKSELQRGVERFMDAAGQRVGDSPSMLSEEERLLRAKLLLEETLETIHALGVDLFIGVRGIQAPVTMKELTFEALRAMNPEEVVDGFADVIFVATGGLSAMGVADASIHREVLRANMDKFGAGGYRNEYGKWCKPPNHRPPDIAGVVAKQRHEATMRKYDASTIAEAGRQ